MRQQTTVLPDVTITTDGAARGNPGPGGWAALLEFALPDGSIREKLVTGDVADRVTNNAMEILAVAGGLAALKRPCNVRLRIDSRYVINGLQAILDGRLPTEKTKNADQWNAVIAALSEHQITMEWVKGHDGDARNERVDAAATAAANRAYAQAEAMRQPVDDQAETWMIGVRSPGDDSHASWMVRTPTLQHTGQVPLATMTANTATWTACIEALEIVYALESSTHARLVIQTNLELIVKQIRGEWKVKTAEHKPLFMRLATLRPHFKSLDCTWVPTASLQELFAQISPP